MRGEATAATGTTFGVLGVAASTSGSGIVGHATGTVGNTFGVRGEAASTAGIGVYGESTAVSGVTYGVFGRAVSSGGIGVNGLNAATTGGVGVSGRANSADGVGVYGSATGGHPDATGVIGFNGGSQGSGVVGFGKNGVQGVATVAGGVGVHAQVAGGITAVALAISGGGIRSSGGPAFVADPGSNDICGGGESFAIDSPYANGDQLAIINVTPRTTASAFRVVWEPNATTGCNAALSGGRWIVETPGTTVTTATEFNAWVVNR
jgi:hypothetical protein